jgi:hypothetical protein
MIAKEADARFLRAILIGLVGATLITGMMAVLTTVRALPTHTVDTTPARH